MAWRRFVICIGMLLIAITRCHCVALSKVSTPNPSIIWKFSSRGNSTQIKTKEAHGSRGRLFIGRLPRQSATLEEHLVDTDYQSDMGLDEAEAYFKAQADGPEHPGSEAVQKLKQTEPNVECTGDSMKLNVQGSFSSPEALFVVDRGSSLAPLPLSELPSSCGYTLNTTQRDLVLVAPYDGCFVSLEEESYVLSLQWWGIPVRMSCPVRRQSLYNPPRVTCNPAGMVVKTDWTSPVDKIQVNLNGHWKPLMEVLPRCGFGFEFASNPGGVAISIRYVPCVGVKDGMFTLGLAGHSAVKVSCPSLQVVDGPSNGVLPTVAHLKYPNIPLAGTPEGQKQNSNNQPPKAQVPVTLPPKKPPAPDNQHPQSYFWQPYYQSPFYPPSHHDGPSQKPASPSSKTELQEPVTQTKPPKTQDSKKPVAPEGQNPWPYQFPYFTRPSHPPAPQDPDQFPPYYQSPFYPPSHHDGPSQKPASPSSKTELQEPVTQTKPPKTHDSKKPVAPEGQNPWPYQFPYFTRPSHPPAPQNPDRFTPYYQSPFYPPSHHDGPSQKPASPTSQTELQEPVSQTKPSKTHDSKKPVDPEGQNPWPYQVPYFFGPPYSSARQDPDRFPPYYQSPFYPPSHHDGPSQKPASPTSQTELQEPVTQTKPPKTQDSKKPVAPEGQNQWPYQVPYFIGPPYSSARQDPDQFPPYYQSPFYPPSHHDGPSQKPASPTSQTELQEPVTQTKPPKTHDSKKPVDPEGQNPWPYQFPYFTRPSHPPAPQDPDRFPPYYQSPFYPPSHHDGPSQKPASPTSKTELQEPVTQTKPPKTHDSKKPVDPEGQNPWPYQVPYFTRPSHPSAPQAPAPLFNPLVQCPQKCPSGLSECCVSFSYHHHDHFIYPPEVDRKIAPLSALGSSVPEEIQRTAHTGIPDSIEASNDTIVNSPLQNETEDWLKLLSQAVKYASKGNKVFAYSPPEGFLNQDLPQSFEPSQSEWGPPTYSQQNEQPTNGLQSQSQTPVNQGQFMILEPGMVKYNMFQDDKASSDDSTDYFEAVHPLSNSRIFEKPTSERPFSNGYVLLEHGPPGSDPSSAKLAARGLGRSHTHLASEPLSHQQIKGKSHLPQPGNQMHAMYRSEDQMTGQEPHYNVPLSDPARIGQFQSNHKLGQAFKGQHSSVDGYPNEDVNQPFLRNGHGK